MILNRTTARTIEILKTIAEHPKGISHLEVVEILKIPQTSAYDILQTLVHFGIVEEVEGKNKRYTLGLESFVIGNLYLQKLNVVQAAKDILEHIADEYNKNVHIAIQDKTKVVYMFRYRPKKSLVAPPSVGDKKDMYCTALGKAILSYLPEDKRNEIINQLEFVKFTDNTIINKDDLIEDIRQTKIRGYSIDDRENDQVTYAVAAPIYNYNGDLVASVSMAGFHSAQIDFEREGSIIKKAAEEISSKLGYFKQS